MNSNEWSELGQLNDDDEDETGKLNEFLSTESVRHLD